MSKSSKTKGKVFELKIAHTIADTFGLPYDQNPRTPNSGGLNIKGDIFKSAALKNLFPYHIECKNHKRFGAHNLWSWIDQSKDDCPEDENPIVIFHRHRTKEDYVVLKLEDFLDLARRASEN